MAEPKCLNCRNTKQARAFRLGQDIVKKQLNFNVGDGMKINSLEEDE